MSEKILDAVATRLEKNLRKQVQKNLAEVFDLTNCKAVAREIRAGRNVTGNAEWGIRFCVHQKTAPRVDPRTLKFTPQSERAKKLDEKFIKLTNDMLETGGFSKLPSDLLSRMRKKDREFEREIKERRRKRRK